MLFDYLDHSNQVCNSDIVETLESLDITIRPSVSIMSFFPKFFDELKTISKRDSFELLVEIEGTCESITDCSNDSYKKIEGHINGFDEDPEYEIELRVKKMLEGKVLSVYFVSCFFDYLSKLPPLNFIREISRFLDCMLTFEVFSKINEFGSDTIRFIEANTPSRNIECISSSYDREKKLSLLFDNATTANLSLELIPDDFYFKFDSEYEEVNSLFSNIVSSLSIVFLSNSSVFEKNGSFTYKISGYKTISETVMKLNYDKAISELLYKIYSWSYEGGNSSDKIGLVRNVLSIHLDDQGRIKYDGEAWQAIQSNYQIYLKENIQSYLDVKNKIGEFVIDSSTRTYTIANEVLSSFKSSIFVFITFLLTVVVVNGLKDSGENTIFSDAYLAIVFILCVVSFIWLLMTKRQVVEQFESASETVKEILQLNYSKVLMQDEIDQCIDPVISKNRKYLEGQVDRYSKWWLRIILCFGLAYGSANLYFENPQILKSIIDKIVVLEPKNSSDVPEAVDLTSQPSKTPSAD